ncbi:IS701 family transposase [Thermoactinospora rubra]|uniref:IS701 family transposase n=1 Tax=Thermoactinospora rubra TaxID=1088767 RepID=UPI000A0F4766|nr:IS701 family transposase [Thermoactinospora rubra]
MASVEHLGAARLQAGLDAAFARVAGRFKGPEVRARARRCVEGLLSGLERKNGWSLAEYAGERSPDGMQRLFNAATWDAEGVRDDIRAYVIDHLGHGDGVPVGDDTGFAKQGRCSAGVQRQYTGTLGKIANCRIGVFRGYASIGGRALIDRELYLPRDSWIAEPSRRAAAQIPEQVGFATKPQLLHAMIERAVAAGLPFAWVTADEAYGDNGPLRHFLEDRRIGYVVAVSRTHQITTGAGKTRAAIMAGKVRKAGWQRLSCGPGAKGERHYDRALIATASPTHHLLIRRSVSKPAGLAFFLCHTPTPVPLGRLVHIVGCRWTIEECFQTGKNEAAFDHYQVRLYPAWYRYMTLAMLALAFLAVTRVAVGDPLTEPADPGSCQLIPMSVNEIRRLFALLTRPPTDESHIVYWSRWRRRRQARARQSHYLRQQARDQ